MFIRSAPLSSTLAIVLFSLGCGSSQTPAENSAANDRNTGSSEGASRGATSGGEDLANATCGVDSVHFGYDATELDSQARDILAQNATCMSRRSNSARVTGMADPRGTEEYNLALGDRRARTVSAYMSNLGVDMSRVSARSVGEEYATGEDEVSWAHDRRAQIDLQ